MSQSTQLSVNVNKIAVLRNSRGGSLPDPVEFARLCLNYGAHGITVHPRPDSRHIRADDVRRLAVLCQEFDVEFNIEGNPFAPPRLGYPGLLALCDETRPAQVTFVPDGDGQITSDHGFDFQRDEAALRDVIPNFKELGCRISCFANAESPDFSLAKAVGADRIELYTGPYAESYENAALSADEASINENVDLIAEVARFSDAAARATAAGLGVNAGHDLNQHNLGYFLRLCPQVAEISIGHALVAECLVDGIQATLATYRAAIPND